MFNLFLFAEDSESRWRFAKCLPTLMVNYYEFWQPTDAASAVLRAGSRPVMELFHREDGKRQLLAQFCPVLPAKAPFQNQTAVAPLCLIRATNPGHLAEGG